MCVYNSNLAPISSLEEAECVRFLDASSLELGFDLMVMNMEVRIFLSSLLWIDAAQSFGGGGGWGEEHSLKYTSTT